MGEWLDGMPCCITIRNAATATVAALYLPWPTVVGQQHLWQQRMECDIVCCSFAEEGV